jgi:hypothetical protein
MEQKALRRQVDNLFMFTAAFTGIAGLLAVIVPNVFEYICLNHAGESLRLRDNQGDQTKITHLVIRLLGAMLLALAWIVFSIRQSADAFMRRAIVQAYSLCFIVSSLAMIRAIFTKGGNLSALNYLTTLVYVALASLYGFLASGNKIQVSRALLG